MQLKKVEIISTSDVLIMLLLGTIVEYQCMLFPEACLTSSLPMCSLGRACKTCRNGQRKLEISIVKVSFTVFVIKTCSNHFKGVCSRGPVFQMDVPCMQCQHNMKILLASS